MLVMFFFLSGCAANTARRRRHGSVLRPRAELSTDCFSWPEQDFDCTGGHHNCIRQLPVLSGSGLEHYLPIQQGDAAIDFTLRALPDGGPATLRLSELLATRPVVLIWGMRTCPVYAGQHPAPASPGGPSHWASKELEYALVQEYQDVAHFVHVYTVDPYPLPPHTNPERGTVEGPAPGGISVDWAPTFAKREAYAHYILRFTHPNESVVVDSLTEAGTLGGNNPLFCSYAMAPRAAFVIGQSGEVLCAQGWANFSAIAEVLQGANATGLGATSSRRRQPRAHPFGRSHRSSLLGRFALLLGSVILALWVWERCAKARRYRQLAQDLRDFAQEQRALRAKDAKAKSPPPPPLAIGCSEKASPPMASAP